MSWCVTEGRVSEAKCTDVREEKGDTSDEQWNRREEREQNVKLYIGKRSICESQNEVDGVSAG